MPLAAVPINFAQGLDTKTDPKQVQAGKFVTLQNTVFDIGGLLQKRNGFGLLSDLPNNSYSYLTTFNNDLTAIGPSIAAYSSSLEEWISKGSTNPLQLSTLSLIKNSYEQTQVDSTIANSFVFTTYTQTFTTTSAVTTQYMYVLADEATGQNIIEPTAIPVIAGGTIEGSSRAFVVGNYFVIVSPVTVSGSTYLQYCSIPTMNPVNLTTNVPNISVAAKLTTEVYVPITSNPGWDGVAVNNTTNNNLVVAYNSTTTAQGVHVALISLTQIAAQATSSTVHQFNNAAYIGAIVSVCVDTTSNPTVPLFYVSFWNNSTSNGYTAAVTTTFSTVASVFTPQEIISSMDVVNLASAAVDSSCIVFSEVLNTYSYDSTIRTDYIDAVTVSSTGTVGTPYVAVRSVGLASKAFIVDDVTYFLAVQQSTYQPTYFLINGSTSTEASPVVVAKVAYENGGNYDTLGLPGVYVSGTTAQVAYLYKDLITALNTLDNSQQTTAGGIYSQTGINMVTFEIGNQDIDTVEVGNNLNISGGFGWMYDGYLPVEQDFFLWPENVECTYTEVSTITPTGTTTTGSNVITAVSSVSGISPGMTITGTAIPSGATVILVGTSTITISATATGNHTAETLTIQGNIAAVPLSGGTAGADTYYYQAIYEWTDNQGNIFRSAPSIPVPITTAGTGTTGSVTVNVPTLRLTYKTPNPLKINIYRWSTGNQVYYQVTSVVAPLLNNTTVDSVSFVDNLPDADIIGNEIIYTTGGVVEDVNPPAYHISTLFDTRQWIVNDEDPNQLWYSKQVIEGTPVEFSDLLTYYIAPNIGTVSSTGPITALFPMDGNLIVFKKNAIYYISGTGPDNTGSNSTYSQPIFITSTIGCPNQQSIVFTPNGLMFQSENGIWLLGRNLITEYIGAPAQQFNGSTVESAITVPGVTQVRFTLDTGQTIMYDYFYGNWGSFVGAPGISSCIYQNLHTFINQYGQAYQETPGIYLDGSNPVLISFTTGQIQTRGISGYQRLIELQLLGSYLTPQLLNCMIGYDYGPLSEQAVIEPMNQTGVYGSDQIYGQTTPYGGPGDLLQWRIQPATQKCQAFQISITEVYNPGYGVPAGAGFTLSAITMVINALKGYRPVKATNTIGTS